MSLFHRHSWIEHGRHFNPPTRCFDGQHVPRDIAIQATWGYTVVLLKCVTCGDQKTLHVTGNAGGAK